MKDYSVESGEIRFSTREDLEIIGNWLKEQQKEGGDESLYCNWEMTKKEHLSNKLLVYIDKVSNQPAAYLWADFGILEVKNSFRNRGIGRFLAKEGIKNCHQINRVAIKLRCAPISSKTFWQKMGFEFYKNYEAYILLNKSHTLPSEGKSIV